MRRAWTVSLLLIVVAAGAPPSGRSLEASVIIVSLEPDTYLSGEPDETIVLLNRGAADVDLSDWVLRDANPQACTSSEGSVRFPAGATLPSGATWIVTQDAGAYTSDHKGGADWEWLVDSDATVPQLSRPCGRLVLANSQDEVFLVDAGGVVVDSVAYGGAARAVGGWSGDPVAAAREGLVLERDIPELGGGRPDTDTASDWDDQRVTMIGQSHWGLETFDDVAGVTTCASPDSSFGAVEAFVGRAASTLDIELYEWTNPHLADAFTAARDRGVAVRVLMEGTPAGMPAGERDQETWILDRLAEAGADVRFMITDGDQDIHDRYEFLHQKIAIRDGEEVLVMSGNWKSTGLPTEPTFGNREWCVLVESVQLAAMLGAVFEDDRDQGEYRDVLTFGAGDDPRYHAPPDDFVPDLAVPAGGYPPFFPAQEFDGAGVRVTLVLSPDTSLFREDERSLLGRIANADHEVLVEQMTLNAHWGPTACGEPCLTTDPSPLLDAVVEAARGGARVRVLVGGEFIDPDDSRNNEVTRDHLNDIAADEGLDLEARIVDADVAEFVKIHNKGVLIDDTYAYVGSMNWGQNSAQDNREIGLLIDAPPVASYFEEIFWYDWDPPAFEPVTNLRADGVHLEQDLLAPRLDDPVSLTPARIVVDVSNTGNRGAGDHTTRVVVTGARGQTETLDLRVPHVRAGDAVTLEFAWQPFAAVGSVAITVDVDIDDEVPETGDDDNSAQGSGNLLLPGPGVWVPAQSVPGVSER